MSVRPLTALLLLLLAAVPAAAQISIFLEFDQDGVLPSAHPDIGFRNVFAAGFEPQVFSVANGVLTGDSLPSINNYLGYAYPDHYLMGDISAAEPFYIEARLRILEANPYNVNSPLGSLTVWNGSRRFMAFHTANSIRFLRISGYEEVPFDISQWHVIRIEGIGGQYDGYIDGTRVVTGLFADNVGGNGFEFQLTDSYSGARIEWDYVRFEAGPDALPNEDSDWGRVKALYR